MQTVTDLIRGEHQRVAELFELWAEEPGPRLAEAIADLVESHAAREEAVFYPVVRDEVLDGDEMIGHAEDEHAEAAMQVAAVRDDPSDPSKVRALRETVEHHVDEEEATVLRAADREIDRDRLRELGQAFAALP